MRNPLVSICVPVHNCEKYIAQCVSSLLHQTYQHIEYIIIDDASTDDTFVLLSEAIRHFPDRKGDVRLIRHDSNQGVAATRIEAMLKARGEYLIHCDGDDFVEYDWIERLVKKACERDADMVYCWYWGNAEQGENVRQFVEPEITEPVEIIKAFFQARMHGSLCNKLYKKDVMVRTGAIDCPSWINMCEDVRINVQLLMHCRKIVMEPAALYHYREAANSLTGTLRNKQSFQSEVDNVFFFERVLPKECIPVMEEYKRRTLMEALILDGMSSKLWHSLWKDVKWKTYKSKYPLKLKAIFYLACVNQPFAVWLWAMFRRHRNTKEERQS